MSDNMCYVNQHIHQCLQQLTANRRNERSAGEPPFAETKSSNILTLAATKKIRYGCAAWAYYGLAPSPGRWFLGDFADFWAVRFPLSMRFLYVLAAAFIYAVLTGGMRSCYNEYMDVEITYLPPGKARGSHCGNPTRRKYRPDRPHELVNVGLLPLSELGPEEDDYSEESFP